MNDAIIPPVTSASPSTESETGDEYVQDVPYTWSFFDYQNPLLLNYAANLNGFATPELKSGFTYCDLGCGNGVTVNLLAAAYPDAHFVGVDFNPEHIENARSFAEAAQIENAEFVCASFADYAAKAPEFDYMAMHGIYSWVSAEVRGQLRTLVDQSLKPGGLVYVSYNAMPGWSELTPLWKMIQGYIAGLEMDSISKAKAALKQLQFLRTNNARFFRNNIAASRHLDRLLARDPNYVAHEFINTAFEPQYFIDVARDYQGLGLAYAGTAKLHRNNRNNIISERFLGHVAEADDPLEAESRQSFIRNELFRRDIYVRADAPLNERDRASLFDDLIVGANVPNYRLNRTHDLDQRRIDLTRAPYRKLVKLAAGGRHSVSELVAHSDLKDFDPADIRAALHDMMAGDQFQPLARRALVEETETGADTRFRLTSLANRTFLSRRLLEDGKVYVKSDIVGSALRLNLVDGLFTWGIHGRNSAEALAFAIDKLQGLDREARNKLDLEQHLGDTAWIVDRHKKFKRRLLPILLRFGILEPTD
jgi:SAM-dependent methyltransferase